MYGNRKHIINTFNGGNVVPAVIDWLLVPTFDDQHPADAVERKLGRIRLHNIHSISAVKLVASARPPLVRHR